MKQKQIPQKTIGEIIELLNNRLKKPIKHE